MKNAVETVIQDRRVTYKRYFDVPIDLTFEALTSPDHLSKWWGPDGFTLTTHRMDFVDGGIWEFVMHGPDGHDYKNKVQFLEIKKPHHIRYKHCGDGEGDPDVDFEARITLEAVGEGTNMTFEQIFPSKEELERVDKKYMAVEGGKQHVAKFGRYLETLKQHIHCDRT